MYGDSQRDIRQTPILWRSIVQLLPPREVRKEQAQASVPERLLVLVLVPVLVPRPVLVLVLVLVLVRRRALLHQKRTPSRQPQLSPEQTRRSISC